MSTILLVEDNPHIMKINAQMLSARGYEVYKAFSASECRQIMEWNHVQLVVLDIMLPDGDGLELCRELKNKYHVPILFLSALGENQDVVDGLRAGGDDYLAKPYDLEVLAARVEARLRQENARNRYVSYGNLKLDTLSGCGYLNDRDLLLTQKEFSVLLLLTRNAENTVSRQEVLREIWNFETEDGNNALWTLISRLRKKLEAAGARLEISSKRGDGYMLELL
jgi:DNA-binding response OmpR family regulator